MTPIEPPAYHLTEAEEPAPRRIRAAPVLAWTATGLATAGAFGHLATSVPAVGGRFSDPDPYWDRRLDATLGLGSVAMFTYAAELATGAALLSSRDEGKRDAGAVVLLVAVPTGLAAAALPILLTPDDWWHGALFNAAPAALATTAVVIEW